MIDYKKYLKTDRKKVFSPINLFLLAINIALLVSVIFLNPNKYIVVSVYFLETFIIGIFNVIKMFSISIFKIRNEKSGGIRSLFMIPFFIVHFGIFYFVQLVLILGFGSGLDSSFPVRSGMIPNPIEFFKVTLGEEGRIIVLGILAAQLFYYFYQFIAKGEYRSRAVEVQMMMPYGRILVQQFLVIIGGFFIMVFRTPIVYSILLIIFKTILDLFPIQLKSKTNPSKQQF